MTAPDDRTPTHGGLQHAVATSSDAADLHATVPTLLLELQASLGELARTVNAGTERGRRPYRVDAEWASRLGEVGYGLFLLADQTGVDLGDVVLLTARDVQARGRAGRDGQDDTWMFDTH